MSYFAATQNPTKTTEKGGFCFSLTQTHKARKDWSDGSNNSILESGTLMVQW